MKTSKDQLTAGELFAGYGGLALAVERALNATTAWVCEFEEAPSKILAQHFPEAPNFRDVTAVDWATVPPVDIISGGSPCQAGHDGWNPLESVGLHARSYQNYSTPPRSVGKRERS